MEGTYGKVYVCNGEIIKKAKHDTCETFIRELYYTSVIPFAIKPLSVLLSKRIRIVYPYGGSNAVVAAQALPLRERINMVFQLLCKVKWLHDNGILHNDLMIGNVLYDTNTKTVHIIDWGLTNYKELNSSYEIYSEYFRAPELCVVNTPAKSKAGPDHHKNYKSTQDLHHSYQSDVWAVGCLIVSMFAQNVRHAQQLILLNNLVDNLTTINIPMELHKIVEHSICDKSQRWSISKMLQEPVFSQMTTIEWPSPCYQYIDMPRNPVYKDCIVYMYKIAHSLELSGPVLGNAINLFYHYSCEKPVFDEELQLHTCQACLSISNKVLGNLYDLSSLVNMPNAEQYTKVQHGVLKVLNPHFIIHPIRYGRLDAVYELYLNAVSNNHIIKKRNR